MCHIWIEYKWTKKEIDVITKIIILLRTSKYKPKEIYIYQKRFNHIIKYLH